MATIVFSTIGSAVGGPLGGAIGALVGQFVDQRLFAPKGRSGPRLSDLKVQTSSYGTTIPRLYGRMRVAGTVIWSTDLVEHRDRHRAGKGQPKVTTYSYTASFAVALSSRAIQSVGRIWAEGNLLRGAAGDFKSPTGFRLYTGDADQPVDPLIAAAVGPAACPAYRGIAYAVFEDMDLSPYGNRIPSLTFEVLADVGATPALLPAADMLGDISVEPDQASQMPGLTGALIGTGDVAEVLEPFQQIAPLHRVSRGESWRVTGGGETLPLPEAVGDTAAVGDTGTVGDSGAARATRIRPALGQMPSHIAISCYDPARDFQLTVQQARVAGGHALTDERALPVAMDAGTAKGIATRMAMDAAQRADGWRWPAGLAALAVPPGAMVSIPGGVAGAPLMVEEREVRGTAIMLQLVPPPNPLPQLSGDAGTVSAAADLPIGTSVAHLFDAPSLVTGVASRLVLAACGTGAGWRGALLSVAPNAASPASEIGTITPARILGHVSAIDMRTASDGAVLDTASSITVTLVRDDMALTNASDEDLLGGANLALLGSEMMQFGLAEPLGERQWRLSRLLRGRIGSEDRIAALAIGDGFALADDPALIDLPQSIGLSPPVAGGRFDIEGMADPVPLSLPIVSSGRAGRPLSPVQLTARWRDDGGLDLGWVARSRMGFDWPDERDAPADERTERWQVELSAGSETAISEAGTTSLSLSGTDIAMWRTHGPALSVAVARQGDFGLSPLVQTTIPL